MAKRRTVIHRADGKLDMWRVVGIPIILAFLSVSGTCMTQITLKVIDKIKWEQIQKEKAIQYLKDRSDKLQKGLK